MILPNTTAFICYNSYVFIILLLVKPLIKNNKHKEVGVLKAQVANRHMRKPGFW